ncbi:MAG TPA: ATP-binding protein [Longimicrobiales bacterium]|nr:ATP-binding protein [Longimicrobiales bacterium]
MTPEAFLAVAEAFPEPCLLLRVDGVVLATNAAAAHLLGRSPAALAGQRLESLADEPETLRRFLTEASGSRTLIPGRARVKRPDGTTADCRAEAAVVRPGGSSGPALVVLRLRQRGEQDRFRLLNQKIEELSREVRIRMRLEEERERLLATEQEARDAAVQANRLKDDFLATLSHELRTPLNAILGWASIIRSGDATAAQVDKGLDTILRAARAQTQLIEDLLDVSRIITGKLRLDLRPIYPAEPVRAAMESVEPTAEAKGVRLEALLDPQAGPVSGDPDRLQQVAWNLLSNAIKFTPRGGRVQVRVEPVNSHVEIIVSDTGEGIDPAVLPHIFDRFRQGEGSLTRVHAGLGLGLSIVRHLVEAHGGQAYAFSDGVGTGATFAVNLPLLIYHRASPLAAAGERTHPRAPEPAAASGADRLLGVHVLVVEDDPDSREMLTDLFASVGAEAVGVRTVAEAIGHVESSTPDVVVSDIELVGEDGYTLARKLGRLPGPRIPAVALTAFARAGDRVRALDAGFRMHLPKPADPAELIAVVASLVGRSAEPS